MANAALARTMVAQPPKGAALAIAGAAARAACHGYGLLALPPDVVVTSASPPPNQFFM